jgi:hypothetical protein
MLSVFLPFFINADTYRAYPVLGPVLELYID